VRLRYILPAIAIAFAVVIFAPPQAEKELTPQDAMANLALNAGYGLSTPQYDGTRWTMHAGVPGCKEHVLLVSDIGMAEAVPKKVVVAKVGNISLGRINASLDGDLSADALKAIPEVKKYLRCQD